jgi:septum formation protein
MDRMEWFWAPDAVREWHLTLASASPRRQQLLAAMGFSFDVISLDIDESVDVEMDPEKAAEELSRRKALALDSSICEESRIFITADTVVAHQGRILGKPADYQEAIAMLKKLSGAGHEVFTGVSLRQGDIIRSFVASSKVRFATLSDAEVEYYVRNFSPFDKAGAYGIQEWIGYIGIEHIEGSYYNVMGLPTRMLYDELRKLITEE